MEAHFFRAAILAASLASLGASYRTTNYLVTAPTAAVARDVAVTAEKCRREEALEWLGRELPPWPAPCPVTVHVGPRLGAGGATKFVFVNGRPCHWRMTIQGSHERLIDSVVPHEVLHMVFASHFGRPLPRWADEGAATSVEHQCERTKNERMLYHFLTTGRGIAFNRMFAMREYPSETEVLPLYAQGYALARFLIAQGGRRRYVQFLGDGLKWNNWPAAIKKHYGYKDLSELQLTWVDWVGKGCPAIRPKATPAVDTQQLASAPRRTRPAPNLIHREPNRQTAAATPSGLAPVPPMETVAAITPASYHVASTASDDTKTEGGWYARRRREAGSNRGATSLAGGGPEKLSPVKWIEPKRPEPAATGPASESTGQMLSRQPHPGRPRQIILEWSRAGTPAPATPMMR